MKRIICSIAVSTAFLLTGLSVSAEEETTWGTIKQQTKDETTNLDPAAKSADNGKESAKITYFGGPKQGKKVPGSTAQAEREEDSYQIEIFAPVGEVFGHIDPDDDASEIVNFAVTPHYAYTLWVPIFEFPDLCTKPCNFDDLGETPAKGTIVGPVAGAVSDEDGLELEGTIEKGDVFEECCFDDLKWDEDGAEFHFIIQCHGPASDDEEELYNQLNYLHGDCKNRDDDKGGDNTCVDIHSGAFK